MAGIFSYPLWALNVKEQFPERGKGAEGGGGLGTYAIKKTLLSLCFINYEPRHGDMLGEKV
jgi:hypothetical protein